MKKAFILIATILNMITVYALENSPASVDCIQISEIEYLVIVRNSTNRDIFIPKDPVVQKSNDSLFFAYKFSFSHLGSYVFKYTINGKNVATSIRLSNYIKPDTIFHEKEDYVPNVAVPGQLLKLRPGDIHYYSIFVSSKRKLRGVGFNIYSEDILARGRKSGTNYNEDDYVIAIFNQIVYSYK